MYLHIHTYICIRTCTYTDYSFVHALDVQHRVRASSAWIKGFVHAQNLVYRHALYTYTNMYIVRVFVGVYIFVYRGVYIFVYRHALYTYTTIYKYTHYIHRCIHIFEYIECVHKTIICVCTCTQHRVRAQNPLFTFIQKVVRPNYQKSSVVLIKEDLEIWVLLVLRAHNL